MRFEFGVGAFILMGFACALALAFASTDARGRVGGETYAVTARFSNLGELKLRAPVKVAGVKIGEVSGIRLDPERYDAIVTMQVARAAGELPVDSSASIYTSGLLGERYVGVSPGGDPETLGDGDEIVMTQSAIVLEQLIGKFMFGNAKDLGDKPADSAAPAETKEIP
ncbi:MAG TPA: outer membrane lipid asymmetry maintenance protein MlaD [Candidatus Saccharimonadia bacterium]|nr:outer membrane lipid asymmetry maintenance protein MlaD [Candidatus Saccharimonadia bacterium]